MKKLLKPISLFLAALTIVSGAGYWWFTRAPLVSEFVTIAPDAAYVDWEETALPKVDADGDRIADALLASAAYASGSLPVLISFDYQTDSDLTTSQLSPLVDAGYRYYPSANVMVAKISATALKHIVQIPGVALVEEDIEIVGLSRGINIAAVNSATTTSTTVAIIDGGTSYQAVHRELLTSPTGGGLSHGNVVASHLLQVDPNTRLVDVTVLGDSISAPVSRLMEGIDWTINSKKEFTISAVNVSAGYSGPTNLAFNRTLTSAAAAGMAVVVPVSNTVDSGEVVGRVPGVVRVAAYDSSAPAPTSYNKDQVDLLAPVDSMSAGPSAAAAEVSGAISKLIASGQAKPDSTDWWSGLRATVSSVDEVMTLTSEQLDGLGSGDEAAVEDFMKSLSGYLSDAINQLQSQLGDSADDQLLKQLLGVTGQLLSQSPTDINSSDWQGLLGQPSPGSGSNLDELFNQLFNEKL